MYKMVSIEAELLIDSTVFLTYYRLTALEDTL